MSITPSSLTKDPDAVLDYTFDWSSWLADSETISTHTILIDDDSTTPIVEDSSSEADGVVTVWLSAGTAGENARVTCRINTSQSRTDDRTLVLHIRQR